MGIDKGILSALADHREKVRGPHFIFSAEKPLHPQNNEMKMGHDQILNHLYHAGYDAHAIKSNYGKPERGIIIYSVDPEFAEELHRLAARLGQGHSIYSSGDAQEMRFHHGAYEGRSHYGKGTTFYDTPPANDFCSLPGGSCHFDHIFDYKSHHLAGQLDKWDAMDKSEKGEGVHQSYREEAKKGFDVLFRVKIRGRATLVDDIPLHMSLKIFHDEEEFDIDEIEKYAKENNVVSPNPKDLKFEPIIFESERTKEEYFMLKVEGLGPQYVGLYNQFKDTGNVYKKFFTHITIDKALYEDIKKNPLKPEEIEFSHLILEAGAGNTIKDFGK